MTLNKKFWNLREEEVEAIPTSCSTQFTTAKIAWGRQEGRCYPNSPTYEENSSTLRYNSPDKSYEHKFLITSSRQANERTNRTKRLHQNTPARSKTMFVTFHVIHPHLIFKIDKRAPCINIISPCPVRTNGYDTNSSITDTSAVTSCLLRKQR